MKCLNVKDNMSHKNAEKKCLVFFFNMSYSVSRVEP